MGQQRWWSVAAVTAMVVPALAVAGWELVDHDPFAAEALVLITPGVVAGRDAAGAAAHDAVAVLGGQALVAYVRDELNLEIDPPVVRGWVRPGSNVVVVRVESDDQETVADVANAYALALWTCVANSSAPASVAPLPRSTAGWSCSGRSSVR
jgi:uncharacterized protein involved in exopolysaccharide biosynthesis